MLDCPEKPEDHRWRCRARALRGPGAGALLAALALAATGCQGTPAGAAEVTHGKHAVATAKVTITSGNVVFTGGGTTTAAQREGLAPTGRAALDKRPQQGIQVSVAGGKLDSVTARTLSGKAVNGAMGASDSDWQTQWALSTSQHYRVTATATNTRGEKTTVSGIFATLTPGRTFTAMAEITPGETYGVGMPIMLTFSHTITDKAAVEKSLSVTSSKPVTGAWYWSSGTQVSFRPESYWPAHTQVSFEAHLKGVRGAAGIYGGANLSDHFTIGNSLIAIASAANHHMKIWYKGHLEGVWPISTGRPGMDTPDGHYLSFDMGSPVDMCSCSYGVMKGNPNYYNELVYYAVQFTNSGDYIHSAPWSVGEQGFENVSHGCVNASPADAQWYYEHSVLGDPITVTGSPVKGTWGDGWTIWFRSWKKLLAGSATGEAVQAGPQGSQFVPASSVASGPAPSAVSGSAH